MKFICGSRTHGSPYALPLCFYPIVLAAILPWAFIQFDIALNTNHAWLFLAAERLLAGESQLAAYYETNPPLSILLYVPAVLLSWLWPLPAYYATYFLGFAALFLSVAAINALLKYTAPFEDGRLRAVALAAYTAAGSILGTSFYFAERDSWVIWGLAPFVLAQLAITRKQTINNWLLWPLLIVCAPLILVKPHYIIFPFAMFVHRWVGGRPLRAIARDRDFTVLAVFVALYALALLTFFHDYLFTIFPDFLSLYVTDSYPEVYQEAANSLFLFAMLSLPVLFLKKNDPCRPAILILMACSMVALFLFVLQKKGFYYQQIPAVVFFYTGLCLALYALLKRFERKWLLPAMLVLIFFAAYIRTPPLSDFPNHEEYKNFIMTKLAGSCPQKPCRFLMVSESMEITFQASFYSGAFHASRFPGFFWLRPLLEGQKRAPDTEERYLQYVAEDLKKWKPSLIVIGTRFMPIGGQRVPTITYLSRHKALETELAKYYKADSISDNRRTYFRGTRLDVDFPLTYDVYRRMAP